MGKPKSIFVIVILLFGVSVLSYGQKKDSLRDNKFCIEITPTRYIDYEDGPSFNVGAEFKLYKYVALYLEGGGYFPFANGISNGDRYGNADGYLIRCEIKGYVDDINKSSGDYISIEGFYKNQSFDWQDSIHLKPAYLKVFRDFKTVYTFNIKIGKLTVYKCGIVFDWYFGFGIRFKDITSTLTPQEAGALRYNDPSEWDSGEIADKAWPQKHIYPNFELGVKVGYRIR